MTTSEQITLQTNIPLQTSNGQMVTTVHLSIMSLSLLHYTTPGWAQVGISGICKSCLTDSQPREQFYVTNPYICIGITKIMKILGQMPPQPWGQIMLTNRYKSLPIVQTGVSGD